MSLTEFISGTVRIIGIIGLTFIGRNNTKRKLNGCKACGYTWHPRGKKISYKCPKCSSEDIQTHPKATILGWVIIVILIIVAIAIISITHR